MDTLELIDWLLSQKEGTIHSCVDPKTLARSIAISCRAWAKNQSGTGLVFARFGIAISDPADLNQSLQHLYDLVEEKKREAATIAMTPS